MKTKWNILVILALLLTLMGGTTSPAKAEEPVHYFTWSPAAPQEGGGWVEFTTTYPVYWDLKWERSSNPGGTSCDQVIGWYDFSHSEFWQSGDYLICLTIYRTYGDPEPIYDTQVMTVTNLPPEIDQMYVNQRGGLVYSVSASTYDHDWATVTCTVDYGDGTGPQPAVGFGLMTCDGPDHEYAAEGTYTATMSLNEAGFVPVTSTITVNVVNVPVDHGFTWSPASPTVGEDVTFSLVYGAPPPEISILWTRSSEPGGTVCDATIGTDVAPVTSFAAAGDYKVCLAVSYLGQPMVTDIQVVTVTDSDLDLTFGTDGQVDTGVRNYMNPLFFPTPSVQQSDGSILVGGFVHNPVNDTLSALLERYTADGALDVSFDSDGRFSPQGTGWTSSLLAGTHIGSQDEILVVGGYRDGSGAAFLFLARYDSAGMPVAGFGTDGIQPVTLPEGWTGANPMASALQSDGKLLITGFTVQGTNEVGFLMRLDPADGTLDTSFDIDGVVLNIAPGQVTQLSDGKILVASPTDWSPFTIYRFTADGLLDTSFGTGGVLEIPASFQCSALAEGPGGNLYLTAGPYGLSSISDFFLARLNDDGSPDMTFGTEGGVFTDFADGSYDQSCSLLVQADGKVIVGGATLNIESKGGSALVRYTANGALDESFGSGGKVFTASSLSTMTRTPIIISQLALTPGGKLLATGLTNDIESENSWISLLRYDLGMAVPTHTVSGMVFDDANANGAFDTGETGLSGVSVGLAKGGDWANMTETTTGSDGSYTFSGLEAGQSYSLNVNPLAGYKVSLYPSSIPSLDADVTGMDFGLTTQPLFTWTPAAPDEGGSATFTAVSGFTNYAWKITDPGLDCGNASWTPPAAIGQTADLSFGGSSQYQVCLRMENPFSAFVYEGQLVTITNLAPVSLGAGITPEPSVAGQPITDAWASFSDVDHLAACTVNYGDGTPLETGIIPSDENSCDGPAHTYASAGTYTVTFTVTDPQGATGTATVDHVVTAPPSSADLSLTNTDSKDPIKPGAQLVYTLTVKNLGSNTAESLVLTDKLDVNTTYGSVSAPRGWTCKYAANSATLTCTAPSLASGASVTIKITVTVSKTAKIGRDLVNTALVSSATYDPDMINNTATQKTRVAK